MKQTLLRLIRGMDSDTLVGSNVIPWSSPVPSFGDLGRSQVATLGLNPSNREFVDEIGRELDGPARRFHTLSSLGIQSWRDATADHIDLIGESCQQYFSRNPYDGWFRRLDGILADTGMSYYTASASACHLDLIPYATAPKWTGLTSGARDALLAIAGDSLGVLLRDSPVRILVLNGATVVSHFEAIAGVRLQRCAMEEWSLPRQNKQAVMGFAYRGLVRRVAGVGLGQELLVLGFNHNIQSSFGVTKRVMVSIRSWIGRQARRRIVP